MGEKKAHPEVGTQWGRQGGSRVGARKAVSRTVVLHYKTRQSLSCPLQLWSPCPIKPNHDVVCNKENPRLNERGKGREALRGTGYFTGPNTPQPNKAKKSPRYLVLYNSIPSGIVPRGSQDQLALLTGTVHQPTGKRQCTRADGGLQGDEANNVTITRPSV